MLPLTNQIGDVLCDGGGGDKGPATLLKKRLWHRYFPMDFAKFLRTPFLTGLRPATLLKK